MCMIKARIRWCSCRVENTLTLGKLLHLLFFFLLNSILFFISQTSYRIYKIISSYELARPIMGTIFLVYVTGSAKRYTNAQAMIFLYKRCYSKTRNIFYSLKNFFIGA